MADLLASVRLAVCVGQSAVPTQFHILADDAGQFVTLPLVDLSSSAGYPLFKWLWQPLGFSKVEFDSGVPWQLPLMKDIQSALRLGRGKRRMDGKYYVDGHLTPAALTVKVRGTELQVSNEDRCRRLLVHLTKLSANPGVEPDDPGQQVPLLMQWFISELVKEVAEFRSGIAVLPGHDLPQALADVPGGQPPGVLASLPASSSTLVAHDSDLDDTVAEQIKVATKSLMALESVKSVFWQNKHGRFRVSFQKPGMKQKYFAVKKYRSLVKQGAWQDVLRALTCAASQGLEHCARVS